MTLKSFFFSFFIMLTTVGVFLPQKTQAVRFSGEYLMKVCALDRNGNERVRGGKVICQSYISGVIDYHNTLRAMDLTSDMNFCIPNDETLNDIHIRVWAYMTKREKLHNQFVAAPGVAMALFSFYPCKK